MRRKAAQTQYGMAERKGGEINPEKAAAERDGKGKKHKKRHKENLP